MQFENLLNVICICYPGAASIARGLSVYVDALTNKTMEAAFRQLYEIKLEYLSEYFDFFAMFIVIVFSGKRNNSNNVYKS